MQPENYHSTLQWIGLVLFLGGQILNAGAYKAIGANGIYYGFKLGKHVPWCHDWPFGGPLSVPHPQYTGSVMSIWGALFVICSPAHYEVAHPYILAGYWTFCYVVTTIIEQYF